MHLVSASCCFAKVFELFGFWQAADEIYDKDGLILN